MTVDLAGLDPRLDSRTPEVFHFMGRAPYLGAGEHELGFCNTAEGTHDPEASHARCSWVYWSKHENGWRSCKCGCHPTGHEANERVRSAILAEIAREEQTMATKTKAQKPSASSKGRKAVEPRDCECECGQQTKGGRFLPGHDAKLKSRLQSEYREASTKRERDKIAKRFDELGWAHFVPVDEG